MHSSEHPTSTTILASYQVGCRVIFCDVELGRFVPSVAQVLACITPSTRALLLPDLIGSPVDWPTLRAAVDALPPRTHGRKVILIQDAADTVRAAPQADIVTTSFYASHVITAGGGGGMVMFDDEELKGKILMYRDWGRIGSNSEDVSERFAHTIDGVPYDFKFLYAVSGYNFKSTEMNAAFGCVQIRRVEGFLALRRRLVERYKVRLSGQSFYELPVDSPDCNWLAFPLLCGERMRVLRFLEDHGVQVRVLMAGNITRHPAYRDYLQAFPECDRIMARGFLVGAHHGMTEAHVDRVCDLLLEIAAEIQAAAPAAACSVSESPL